jgi:GNAT superfamily N-acetyltransferase
MIRPAAPADIPTLVEVAGQTGVFKPMELDTLHEVLDDYFAGNDQAGHRCFVLDEAGPIAFEYHGPEAMTEGTWCLWWIAVRPDTQGKGLGARLLHFAEQDIRAQGGRVLFIETSGLPYYDPTRRFYLKYGYDAEARLRDFYAAGDDKVVFRKVL